MAIAPTAETIQELMKGPADTPVVMVVQPTVTRARTRIVAFMRIPSLI